MTARPELNNGPISEIAPISLPNAMLGFGHAAYTLFATPEHDKLHQTVEAIDYPPQPLQADIYETTRAIQDVVISKADIRRTSPMDGARLTALGGILIQFTDYVPRLQKILSVPYNHVARLHDSCVETATEAAAPLGYAEQLETALRLTDGDLTKSLWRLFITSRLNARWLDGKVIDAMPNYSREEKVALMLEWRSSITACKVPDEEHAQDPNGDTYYTWTHALASVAMSTMSARQNRRTRAAATVFQHGTSIMHTVVHNLNAQAVQSDHSVAANYGNAIGLTLVDIIQEKTDNSAA